MRLVIIGLGAAGFAAALAIKKTDRKAELTIIDEKDYDLMHPCGLPFALEGKVKIENLKHPVNIAGVEKIKGKAKSIDVKNKKVLLENKEVEYDKLLIATGSSPFIPQGMEKALVVKDPESVEEIQKKVKGKVTIVGAGAIGLETAFALSKKAEVEVIEMLSQCFPNQIDPDISGILEDYLKSCNIKLSFNKKLDKITQPTIMAEGIRPNTGITKDTGIKVDKAIIVDETMQTNIQDIYAAGDVIMTKSLVNQKPSPAWIASAAYKQGTVAGTNMAGGNSRFKGSLAPLVSVIGDIEVGATGFNSSAAKKFGYDIIEGKSRSRTKPDWFEDAEEIAVKLIADKKTGKVIGGQAIGKQVKSKIDILSIAISSGFSLQQLSDQELAYCPAVSQTYDVLTQAADLALRKI